MNNEQNNQPSVNLIKRLISKFKASKISKKIETLTLAGALALTLASCDHLPTPNDPPYTNNGGDNNNQQDNQNQSQNQIDLSKYSELLQNVLNNEEYNTLISQYPEYERNYYNAYQGHPYAFLEDEGYNINNIKNNLINCETNSYIFQNDPNSLYLITKIETTEGIEEPYYTQYILKYSLTEQEAKDYHLLHQEFSSHAPFLNQELSKLKEPEVISELRCTSVVEEGLKKSLNSTSAVQTLKSLGCLNGENIDNFVFLNFQKGAYPFEIMAISTINANEHSMIANAKIDSLILNYNYNYISINSDDAFTGPYLYGGYLISENNTPAYAIATHYRTDGIKYNKHINIIDELSKTSD